MHIDLLDPKSFDGGQPHDQFRWLRENAPVYRHAEPAGEGFWALTRYEDVRAVGRDSATFSSSPTIMIPDAPGGAGGMAMPGDRAMMLMMDPPRHNAYRRLVSAEFTPRVTRARQPRIRALARQIVDAVCEEGRCDLVEEIAGEMPSYVIAELMGLPLDEGRELYRLTETIHADPSSVPEGAQVGAVLQMLNRASALAKEKRARPGDDLASRILDSEVDGRRLDDIDFNLFFLLLIDAGGDTTRNLVSSGMLALFDHPEQRALLTQDLATRLPIAVEEMLRFTSPVIYMRRTATKDTRIGDARISEGDKVVMYYGAANRDPEMFARPESFEVTRAPNHHVAFGGGGAHYCLGAHLARLEIIELMDELLTRLPDLEPDGPVEWLASTFISGPSRMPVRFTPSPISARSGS